MVRSIINSFSWSSFCGFLGRFLCHFFCDYDGPDETFKASLFELATLRLKGGCSSIPTADAVIRTKLPAHIDWNALAGTFMEYSNLNPSRSLAVPWISHGSTGLHDSYRVCFDEPSYTTRACQQRFIYKAFVDVKNCSMIILFMEARRGLFPEKPQFIYKPCGLECISASN